MDEMRHLDFDELKAGLDAIRESPATTGRLEAIVVRPTSNDRQSLDECELTPEGGVTGDNWALGCWLELPDGRPHPDVQVTIMNSRSISLISQDRSRWPLAGDQLFADFDLSTTNLPVGQRIAIGSTVLEISHQPHLGCKKFAQRFGNDALKFVNYPEGKALRLRGVYARIIEPGTVATGDPIRKI